jgi:reactive intermediate/imine deaminase
MGALSKREEQDMRNDQAALLAAAASSDDVEILRSDAVNPPGLPFSDGVRIGRLVILSGMLGIKPHTLELAVGGLEAETRQTFENLRAVLAAHGMSLRDVARVQVMLANIADWPRFNDIYREFFAEPFPARSAFAANGLALGARVEVEAFAVKR